MIELPELYGRGESKNEVIITSPSVCYQVRYLALQHLTAAVRSKPVGKANVVLQSASLARSHVNAATFTYDLGNGNRREVFIGHRRDDESVDILHVYHKGDVITRYYSNTAVGRMVISEERGTNEWANSVPVTDMECGEPEWWENMLTEMSVIPEETATPSSNTHLARFLGGLLHLP